MKSLSVFCASAEGKDPAYMRMAREVGRSMAERGLRVVFGGSKLGLMGAVANGALEAGGEVVGVLPRFMQPRELAHEGLTELIYVDSMQERKLKMHELSDGVLTLPGGFGTMEELFEMLTWSQLGLHQKPIGILNVSGYYNHFLEMINHMTTEGLLAEKNARLILTHQNLPELLDMMDNFRPTQRPINMKKSEA